MNENVKTGMSNAAYHSSAGISKSGLDLIAKSPLHYWSAYLDPKRAPRVETPAMALGTAIHSAVLEPEKFAIEFRAAPAVDKRTKAGKEIWEAFVAECEAEGARPISAGDLEICNSISEMVRHHPTAKELLGSGLPEVSMFWEDEPTGTLCKCRPDWVAESNIIVDLKSTVDASPNGFMRSAFSYRYWVQAAWYLDGIEKATGEKPEAFVFVAFEKEPPYAVGFYYATEDMIEAGRREYRRLLDIYSDCLQTSNWRGYSQELLPLDMPPWAKSADQVAA